MALTSIPVAPITYNITLYQGASFLLSGILRQTTGGTPIDLTGITLRAKVRPDFATAAVLTFTCTIVSAPAGTFTIAATPAQIAALTVPASTPDSQREVSVGEWDLELDDGSLIGRFAEGTVTLSREATT